MDVGGFNVLSVNWSGIAGNKNYMWPVLMASTIGDRLAKVLGNIVRLGVVQPKDVHLIGHSLGAHIAGICGSSFQSEKIGRITGTLTWTPVLDFFFPIPYTIDAARTGPDRVTRSNSQKCFAVQHAHIVSLFRERDENGISEASTTPSTVYSVQQMCTALYNMSNTKSPHEQSAEGITFGDNKLPIIQFFSVLSIRLVFFLYLIFILPFVLQYEQ